MSPHANSLHLEVVRLAVVAEFVLCDDASFWVDERLLVEQVDCLRPITRGGRVVAGSSGQVWLLGDQIGERAVLRQVAMVILFPLLSLRECKLLQLLKLRQMEQLFLDCTAKVVHQASLANVPPVFYSLRVNLRLSRIAFICQTCFLVVRLQVGEGLELGKLCVNWINRSQERAGQLIPRPLASV